MEGFGEFFRIANWIATIIFVITGVVMVFILLRASQKLKALKAITFRSEVKRILSLQLGGASDQVREKLSAALEEKVKTLLFELENVKNENRRLKEQNILLSDELTKPQRTQTLSKPGHQRQTWTKRLSQKMEEMQIRMEKMEHSAFRKEFAFFILGLIAPSAITLVGKFIIWGYKILLNVL